MKKRVYMLVTLLFILTLTGCGGETLTSPPALTVECGNASIEAWLGTYSWTYRASFGSFRGVESDSAHPLDCKDSLPVLEAESSTVVLRFAETPDSISVRCWSDDHWSDPSAESEEIAANGNGIELRSGGYIYEVYAKWSSQGSAHYAFYAVAANE